VRMVVRRKRMLARKQMLRKRILRKQILKCGAQNHCKTE